MSNPTPTLPGRYACIDCGTNSVKLIVADLAEDSAEPVFQLSETTRIGEGMQANAMHLQEEPMRRTLEAIVNFAAAARDNDALETVLIGTAALRDAHISADFVRRVQERCGLTLEIITGQEEARLSFLAVREDPYWRDIPQLLVIDIGGGSTELIQGEAGTDRIQARTSVNLGAVKLTEAFLRSDPPAAEQIAAANRAAAAAFDAAGLLIRMDQEFKVVGVGGTLTNLGAMKLASALDPEALHGMTLRVPEIEGLRTLLAQRSVEERRMLPGLDPRRADIILAGAMLLLHALAHIQSDRVGICTRGLRWGVLYDRFLSHIGKS